MTKDRMIIEKQKEYIEFLGQEIGDHATYLMIHNINPLPERIEKGKQLRNELKSLESLPDRPLYEQVYIKTEADLPEEDGVYFVAKKNTLKTSGLKPMIYTIISRKKWLSEVEYYLRPVK